MEWRRTTLETDGVKNEAFSLYVGGRLRLGVLRSRDHGGAWIIFGVRSDDSRYMIVSSHEIISDVKREAEGYL